MAADAANLNRLQQRALMIGGLGLGRSGRGVHDRRRVRDLRTVAQFFRSWLVGFLFCLGLSLGSLALLMLQHLSGGQWGLVSRRVLEAAHAHAADRRAVLPPGAARHAGHLQWARPERGPGDAILRRKRRT